MLYWDGPWWKETPRRDNMPLSTMETDSQSIRGKRFYKYLATHLPHVFEIIIKITKQIILIYFIFNKPYHEFYKLIHK